jgi:hypothetical protein
MNYELAVQKVLKTITCIKEHLKNSEECVENYLGSCDLEEAARQFQRVKVYRQILSYLENDIEEAKKEDK